LLTGFADLLRLQFLMAGLAAKLPLVRVERFFQLGRAEGADEAGLVVVRAVARGEERPLDIFAADNAEALPQTLLTKNLVYSFLHVCLRIL